MPYRLLVLAVTCAAAGPALGSLRLTRVATIPSGPHTWTYGRVACADVDRCGRTELVFSTGTIRPDDPLRWEVWQYQPVNRFVLVYADTGAYPEPIGIEIGNFQIQAIGDMDCDGLADLIGIGTEWPRRDTMYWVIGTVESRDSFSIPDSLTWYMRCSEANRAANFVPLLGDLDRDGRPDILTNAGWPSADGGGWIVIENRGNDTNEVVWRLTQDGCQLAIADLDGDSAMEFVTATIGTRGRVFIFENTGPDQYAEVFRDSLMIPNSHDVFAGNDVDQDGRPEFFIAPCFAPGEFYLFMFEAVGNDVYEHILVAEKYLPVSFPTERRSCSGDLDGDGVEEIIWTLPTALFVYKATGNNQFEEVWSWYSDHGQPENLTTTVCDVNQDGYNELVAGGAGNVSIFEVEAVRVLRPNGGNLVAVGETLFVKWQVFTPPRCDSLSVWFTPDNGGSWDLLAPGLAPDADSIPWIVPNTLSDSCKIKVVAYGPGTRFDESDSCFSIVLTGVLEMPERPVYRTGLAAVTPQPVGSEARIRFQLAAPSRVRLSVLDVSGRTAAVLADGVLPQGVHSRTWYAGLMPGGIYFLKLDAPGFQAMRKVVLAK
jgi:hypothetical protein